MIIIKLVSILPRNLISYFSGFIVRLKLPRPFSKLIIHGFVRILKIDLKEAEKTINEFFTIEDVFIRRLKPGSRPIQNEIVSPVDGYLTTIGMCKGLKCIQAKGLYFNAMELCFGKEKELFDPSFYVTIYLAPHSYHRVHSPLAGELKSIRYIPGTLWPVNSAFVRLVPKLFEQNERLVFEIKRKEYGRVFLVMIGALNVGRMSTPFDSQLISNSLKRQVYSTPEKKSFSPGKAINCGEELGVFMLGSTVIILFEKNEPEKFLINEFYGKKAVKVGENIVPISAK